ncbi:MAG: (2Fe-2S) ferredoxin domain-containing protein [Bacteroidales bacterium]|nr:(2Fe-2S) ferredoxin domain-containing protein [Bacteroidales bacterium]MBQ9312710.1 (2Fe-2S) ferredoxin domain-containing protein [Bacteroidales bacterium]
MEEKVNITICLGSSCFAHGNNVNLKFIKDYLKDNNLMDKVNFKGELCNKLCNEGPVVVIDNVTYKGINKMQLEQVLDKTFKHQ